MYIVSKDKQTIFATYDHDNFPREDGDFICYTQKTVDLTPDFQGKISLPADLIDKLEPATSKRPLISLVSSSKKPIQEIDYVSEINAEQGSLYKTKRYEAGLLVSERYYKDYEEGVFHNLVVSVDYSYPQMLSVTGGPLVSEEKRTWYYDDGSEVEKKKISKKIFSLDESMKEGVKRRERVINDLQTLIASVLIPAGKSLEDGRDLMSYHKTNIELYTKAASSKLVDDIDSDLNPILTIKSNNKALKELIKERLEEAI
jgi:hypothetical protein